MYYSIPRRERTGESLRQFDFRDPAETSFSIQAARFSILFLPTVAFAPTAEGYPGLGGAVRDRP
jgi:hypothetical protein